MEQLVLIPGNLLQMDQAGDQIHGDQSISDESKWLNDHVKPYFDAIREHADALEV